MNIDELRELIKDLDGNTKIFIETDDNGSYQQLSPFQGYMEDEFFIIRAR